MNSQEYKEYEADVAEFFERECITNMSSTYDEDTGEGSMEPFFSWSPCQCCGSTLGGDRQECSGYNPTTKEVHGPFTICQDCEYYAEYGRLDDQTMLDIEEDQKEVARRHAEDIEKELKEIQRRQAAHKLWREQTYGKDIAETMGEIDKEEGR